MKKVLITGSSGFLGRHLILKLEKMGVEYLALNSKDCDLTQENSLFEVVNNSNSFDFIFHLAAWTQAGTFCDTHRGIQWIVNQQINTNVLNWWYKEAPQAKLIALGTSVSYTVEENLTEDIYMEGIPSDKFFAYAHCKRMLLVGMECLNRQYGMSYLYLVPSTLYGSNYHTDDRQSHFIFDLIRKIIRGKKFNETVILWGNGEQRRELVFIDDFVDIMLKLSPFGQNEIINVGGEFDYSIKDFAKLICEIVDYDPSKIQYDIDQYVGSKSKVLDVKKMKSILKNYSSTPIQIGLKDTINWVERHYF